jgi:hypothetical protein
MKVVRSYLKSNPNREDSCLNNEKGEILCEEHDTLIHVGCTSTWDIMSD